MNHAQKAGNRPGFFWRWCRRLFVVGCVLIIALVVAHGAWGRQAKWKLDAYLDGLRSAGQKLEPHDFHLPDVPENDNAATLLGEAARLVNRESEAWKRWALPETIGFPLTPDESADAATILKDAGAAREKVRQATSRPSVDWGVRYQPGAVMQTLLPFLTEQHSLSNLLSVYARVAHTRSDDAAALLAVRDMLFIGRCVDDDPMLVSHLAALGISGKAATLVQELSSDLKVADDHAGKPPAGFVSRAEVRQLIDELLDDARLRVTRVRCLHGERMMVLDTLQAVADGRLSTAGIIGGKSLSRAEKLSSHLLNPVARSDARLLAEHLSGVATALAAPDYPAFVAAAPPPVGEQYATSLDRYQHVFLLMLAPATHRVAKQDYKAVAERRMAAVMLAARLYAIDHDGRLPPALDALVPNYLSAVPLDPLASGRPLGYVATGDDPRIYSVGENGRDDGGFVVTEEMPRKQAIEFGDETRPLRRRPRKITEPETPAKDTLPPGP